MPTGKRSSQRIRQPPMLMSTYSTDEARAYCYQDDGGWVVDREPWVRAAFGWRRVPRKWRLDFDWVWIRVCCRSCQHRTLLHQHCKVGLAGRCA